MREGAEKEDGGEERGVKNAATLTRGAATPPGAFKSQVLIVRSSLHMYSNYSLLLIFSNHENSNYIKH